MFLTVMVHLLSPVGWPEMSLFVSALVDTLPPSVMFMSNSTVTRLVMLSGTLDSTTW